MKFKLLECTLFLSPPLFNGIAYGIDFHTIRGAPEAVMKSTDSDIKRNLLAADGAVCTDNDDCVSNFCVNSKCAANDGTDGAVCTDNDDCLSSKCGGEGTCVPHSITDLALEEVSLTDTDCSSVHDIIPTFAHWQGAFMPDGGTNTIAKITTPTLSNINRFLAYAYTGGHCKMVLFQIERDTATNVCSYKPLAGKFLRNQDCSVKGPYCSFLGGECTNLVGDNYSNGYGIEALDYEYKTATEPQTHTCEDDLTASTTDFLCTGRENGDVCIADSDCVSGLCGADGMCKGLDGSQCAQSTDCKSYLCGSGAECEACVSRSDCNVSGLDYCVDGVCTDGEVGSICTSGTDHCESGFCVGNICTTGDNEADCASSDDCVSKFCVNNKCSSGLNGATCSSDSHCQSNYCLSTKCATRPPPDPCKNNPCGPGQKCDKTSDYSYSCKCETTFVLVGEDTPKPKCECKAGETTLGLNNRCYCIKEGMVWSDQEANCKCPSGEEWSDEDLKCVEANPCANKTCGDNETCNPSTGECSCNDGYEPGPDDICVKSEGGDSACEDDASFTFVRVLNNGEKKTTFCSWFTWNSKRIDRRRFKFCYNNKSTCTDPSDIGSKCMKACGFCDEGNLSTCAAFASTCTDDLEFKFPMKKDPNEERGCSWITKPSKQSQIDRRRSNYCSQKYILRKCPKACERELCV